MVVTATVAGFGTSQSIATPRREDCPGRERMACCGGECGRVEREEGALG